MKSQVYQIGVDGFIVETQVADVDPTGAILNPAMNGFVSTTLSHGLYRAKWVDGKWVEDMSQSEIDEMNKPLPIVPSDTEILGQQMTEREIEAMVQREPLLGS